MAQLRICRDYCHRKGYAVINEYADEAISGISDNRAEYTQMIKDAQKHLFDVVVFHKVDRNARNEYVYYMNKMKLIRAGIRVEYAAIGMDLSTPEGQLMENQMVGFAAFYSRNLSNEVRKGHHENALAGMSNGGLPNYGYKYVDKHYAIVESEAEVVRFIFERYLANDTYSAIADAIVAKGIKTRKGKDFTVMSIRSIIKRVDKYAGDYVYGLNNKSKLYPLRKPEPVIVKDAIPAIITREQQRLTNEKRAKFKHVRGHQHAKVSYPLFGKILCGECERAMHGDHHVKNDVSYRYYRCRSVVDHKAVCHVRFVPANEVEVAVLHSIRTTFGSYKSVCDICNSVNRMIEKQSDIEPRIRTLENEYNALETKNANLLRIIEDGDLTDMVMGRMKSNAGRMKAITSEIAELRDSRIKPLDARLVYEQFNKFASQEDADKKLIQAFLYQVKVFKDSFSINLKVEQGGKVYFVPTKK